MSVWSVIALVIGGIAALACLLLAAFGAGVVILLCASAKEEYSEWKKSEGGGRYES